MPGIIWLRNGWISRHVLSLGTMSQYSGKSPYSTMCHVNGILLSHSMPIKKKKTNHKKTPKQTNNTKNPKGNQNQLSVSLM